MNDREIRDKVIEYFKKIDPNSVARHEITISNNRLDILILVNDLIVGVEIKGDSDTFERLYDQLVNYMSVCDRVYIATHKKDLPTDIPFFFGHLAIRDDKCYELRRPKPIKNKGYEEIICKEVLEKTLDVSGLPKEWAAKLEELLLNLESVQRTLFLNETFGRYVDNRDEGNYKYSAFDNKLLIANYLRNVKTAKNMFEIKTTDSQIKREINEELDRITDLIETQTNGLKKTIKTVREYSLRELGMPKKEDLVK